MSTCQEEGCKHYYDNTYGLNTTNAFRDIIIAPAGKVVMNADWAQLEVWVLGYWLAENYEDEKLLNVLLSGRDIHVWAAKELNPTVDPDMPDGQWRVIHKALRSRAKTYVFGTNYGLTVEGAAKRTGETVVEAARTMKRWTTNVVPGLQVYFKDIERRMVRDGRICNKFGRWRHTPEARILQVMGRGHDFEALVREGYNMPIQSGGSDLHSIVSRLTVDSDVLRNRGWDSIMSVHDSFAGETNAPDHEYAARTAWQLKTLWEETAKNLILPDGKRLGWQCVVEVEWGQRWGDPEWVLSANGEVRKAGD